MFDEEKDEYRPNPEALSNAEGRATGILGQGGVMAIARELLESRKKIAVLEWAIKCKDKQLLEMHDYLSSRS